MTSRVVAGMLAGVVAAVLAVGLAGCSGAAPKASPSPTPPFASADAAYEAAEATYRGYVDAGNHVDLADDKTLKPVYAWLLGDALATDTKELSTMAARGWELGGRYKVSQMSPVKSASSDPKWGEVQLAACLDVSSVTITDADGRSMVSPNRPDVLPVTVKLWRDASTSTGLKITKIQKRSGAPLCGE